jgi:sigma-B regulation protein RsbU (phosphoserine phosphatase)
MIQILVIDDDPLTQTILKKALRGQGYEVTIASDGEEGLALAQLRLPGLIICDWMMPGIDGLEVCRQVKAMPELSTTFFILLTSRGSIDDRVQGLDTGADDFLAKPIEVSELQARVRAGLRLHQLSRDLQLQKQLLERELAEAASYVRSLLPAPLIGSVYIDSRFIPSSQLGGDCFDYYWLDPDYLAIYLLDVSGHGLGAALPSISVLNLLRSQSLADVNFYQPHDVLRALNDTFQMDSQNAKYFTIWYGVYNRTKRILVYASAGHPPALLFSEDASGQSTIERLRTPGVPIGMLSEATFTSDRQEIPPGSTLYIFSDGIYEAMEQIQDQLWGLEAFVHLLKQHQQNKSLDHILENVRLHSASPTFSDDLSLLQIRFV